MIGRSQCNDVWLLYVDPNHSFSVDTGSLAYFKRNFSGTEMQGSWIPPQVAFSNKGTAPKDFVAWMPAAPIVSQRARLVLEAIPGIRVEFLPLFVHRDNTYFAMNATEETTRLDRSRSQIEYFDESHQEIMMVRTACFKFKEGQIPPAFKIKGYPGDVYVGHAFASAAREAGLSGVMFLDPAKDVLHRVISRKVSDDFPSL